MAVPRRGDGCQVQVRLKGAVGQPEDLLEGDVMKIAAWVREIADTRDLVGDVLDRSGNPRWDQWESRIDPEDLNGLEMALHWKDRDPSIVVVALTVGYPRKIDVLRECLYRGVDEVVRILPQDKEGGVMAQARWVALGVNRVEARAVFTGVQVNECEEGIKGAFLASALGWPSVTYVESLEDVGASGLRVKRAVEDGIETVEVSLPAVLSVGVALVKDDPRTPRSAKAKLKLQHKKTPIPEWGAVELGNPEGSRLGGVRVLSFKAVPIREYPAKKVDGSNEEELGAMVQELRNRGLVR